MAVPVVGLAFSLGYLADDMNLWEKHGVKSRPCRFPASAR